MRCEGPFQRRSRSSLGSDLEIWPHIKLMTVTRFGRILALPGAIPKVCFGYVFGMLPKEVPRRAQRLPKAVRGSPKRCPKVTQRVPKLTQRTQGTPTCSQKVPQDFPNGTQRSPKGFHNSVQRKAPQGHLRRDKGELPKVIKA